MQVPFIFIDLITYISLELDSPHPYNPRALSRCPRPSSALFHHPAMPTNAIGYPIMFLSKQFRQKEENKSENKAGNFMEVEKNSNDFSLCE